MGSGLKVEGEIGIRISVKLIFSRTGGLIEGTSHKPRNPPELHLEKRMEGKGLSIL